MKLKKYTKDMMLATTLALSAVVFTVVFIVTAIRKKSLWQAMLALTGAGCAVGATFLAGGRRLFAPTDCAEQDTPEDDGAELFEGDACEAAEVRLRHVLGGERDGETAPAPSVRREIPRDEEATEADFV